MLITEYDEEKTMRQFREEGYEEGREDGREEGRKEGRKEGREEGREEGRQEMILNNIRNLTETFQITVEKAMEGLKIPVENWGQYAALLSN